MKVFLDFVGCRLNQSEIEKFALQFRSAGHTIVSTAADADMVVINTCTVTAKAASDSRQKVRQAAKVTPGQIQVTGCWATLERQSALALPKVSRVVVNEDKDRLVADLLGPAAGEFRPGTPGAGAAAGDSPPHAGILEGAGRLRQPLHFLHHARRARQRAQPPGGGSPGRRYALRRPAERVK